MKRKLHFIMIYFSYIIFPLTSFSQRQFSYIDGYSINASLGMATTTGELGHLGTFNPVISIAVEKGISQKINLTLESNFGKLSGHENEPYFSRFESEFFQVNFLTSLNLSRLFEESRRNSIFRPYLGMGMIWFHTDVFDLKTGAFLRTTADGTTRHTSLFQQAGIGVGNKGIYYTRELVVPFGFMTELWLNKRLSTIFDLRYSWVYNDKLDATTAYNLTTPHKIGGVNSYSDTANDGWINLSVGLKYKFVSLRIMKQRGI
ncbi:hypothetical protein VB776_18660 [Arcicella sp. DC2W]|uniref:Outer membrane protein beta-barrel domain-containing protein n=1 Tax=Arcicella gelida TaxID=2984195 RepID=A0ABU5S909_9BACT|nr:hypothetical protein [Arcicella sp. DC2W]MEA5404962.1 hypothetical protein [Arcicella sp. DC2W]